MFSDCSSWASLRPSAFCKSCGVSLPTGPFLFHDSAAVPSALNQSTSQVTVLAKPSLVGLAITCTASQHCIRVFARCLARLTISCTILCADNQRHTCQGAVSRRWAAFLSAPSSSLDFLVDEIFGVPRTSGDVLLMTRSPKPSPSRRNHQTVSSARTACVASYQIPTAGSCFKPA